MPETSYLDFLRGAQAAITQAIAVAESPAMSKAANMKVKITGQMVQLGEYEISHKFPKVVKTDGKKEKCCGKK